MLFNQIINQIQKIKQENMIRDTIIRITIKLVYSNSKLEILKKKEKDGET